MCVRGDTATPRTPARVAGRLKVSTSLKWWSRSYTWTGPSLKMYSRCSRLPVRASRAVFAEGAGPAGPTRSEVAGVEAEPQPAVNQERAIATAISLAVDSAMDRGGCVCHLLLYPPARSPASSLGFIRDQSRVRA